MVSAYITEFLMIALVHLLAVASPGPDFAIVVKQSITHGRRTAMLTSMGIGLGILIHVGYSLLGIGVVISQSIIAFTVMKFVAALYLIFIGIKALRARPEGTVEGVQVRSKAMPSAGQAILTGFMTNGLNPKATLFFLSLFTVIISPSTPIIIQAGYGLYMALATALWFILVSVIFGSDRVRSSFKRIGHWFERFMGTLLVGLGLKLAVSSAS